MTTRPMLLALMAAAVGLGCLVVTGDTDLPETALLARADDWSTKVTSGHFAFHLLNASFADSRSPTARWRAAASAALSYWYFTANTVSVNIRCSDSVVGLNPNAFFHLSCSMSPNKPLLYIFTSYS